MADDKDKEKPAPKKPAAGNVFDVRRPGKAPASPTSRPVILGHKPEAEAAQAAVSGIGESNPALTRRKIQIMPSGDVQTADAGQAAKDVLADPAKLEVKDADGTPVSEKDQDALAAAAMDAVAGPPALPEVKHEEAPKPLADKSQEDPEEKPSGEEESRPAMLTKPKLVIQPLSEVSKPAAEESKPDAEPVAEAKPEAEGAPSPDTIGSKPESDPEQPAPTTAEESSTASSEESASAEDEQKSAVAESAAEGQEAQKEEEQKPEPHIEPLFDQHGVVISSHNHGHRSHRGLQTFLLVLLILVLAAAALDILLDLNVLNLPVNVPHTDFL